MDNITIKDLKHFEFWCKEIKKHDSILDKVYNELENQYNTLLEEKINTIDIIKNIELSKKITELESILNNLLTYIDDYTELSIDLNEWVYAEKN